MNGNSPITYFGWLLLHKLGEINQAEKYFQILLNTLTNDHQDIPSIYNGIGSVYSQRNQLDLALENYRIALKIRQERNDSRLAVSYHNIGNILLLINLKKITPNDYQTIAQCLTRIGRLCRKYGKFNEALQFLHDALISYRQDLLTDPIDIAIVIENLALCYRKINKTIEALSFFNESLLIYRTKYGIDHEIVKSIEANIIQLNVEQTTELIENNITKEEHIIISIDSNSLPSLIEPISIPQSNDNEIENQTKPSVKRSKCSNCILL
ncbi:hypothetical protein I4U23_000147 [Adineta vaga]|nr:hypothetical protein I4U23_000147 [Adineta vaga]